MGVTVTFLEQISVDLAQAQNLREVLASRVVSPSALGAE